MSSVDDALRRWWEHDRPNVERELRRAYNVGSVPKQTLRMMYRCMRETFIAGWKAHERMKAASGTQSSLFEQPGDDHGQPNDTEP